MIKMNKVNNVVKMRSMRMRKYFQTRNAMTSKWTCLMSAYTSVNYVSDNTYSLMLGFCG